MPKLSVNINKIATLRNSRGQNIPDLLVFAKIILDAGAQGITVHPREDERHITKQDVFQLKDFLKNYNKGATFPREFNIEGEPSSRFLDLVLATKPDQVTLVPVTPGEITSDHGFSFQDSQEKSTLQSMLKEFRKAKIRTSLFMDTTVSLYKAVKEIGADRIELYTGPFAHAFDSSPKQGEIVFREFRKAALEANELGLGINAGHDLDSENLKVFSSLPHLAEVSIGHRLVTEALLIGMPKTVVKYLRILSKET